GKLAVTLKASPDPGKGVIFSPDGKRLVMPGPDGVVRMWDVSAGREVFSLKDARPNVTFSPDGRRLAASVGDAAVGVRDAATGREAHALKGHTGMVIRIAFSPDGRRLVSASWDQADRPDGLPLGVVKVWDLATGQEVFTLKGRVDHNSVGFSPDGRRLAGIN